MGQRGQRQLASAVSHAENRGGRALGSTFAPRGVWVWRVRQCVVIEQHAPSRLKFAICSADRGPMAATVSLAVLIVVSYPASIRPSCSVPVLVRPYELSRPGAMGFDSSRDGFPPSKFLGPPDFPGQIPYIPTRQGLSGQCIAWIAS